MEQLEQKKKDFAPIHSDSLIGMSIVVLTIDPDAFQKYIKKKGNKASTEAREKEIILQKIRCYLEERGARVHRVYDALYAYGLFGPEERKHQLQTQAKRYRMNIIRYSGTKLPDPREPDPLPPDPPAPPKRPRGRPRKVVKQP